MTQSELALAIQVREDLKERITDILRPTVGLYEDYDNYSQIKRWELIDEIRGILDSSACRFEGEK